VGICGCVGVWVCGCVGVWVCGYMGVWVCIQNRKLQNSLRSVGNCFASRSNFLLRCVRINFETPKIRILYPQNTLLQKVIGNILFWRFGDIYPLICPSGAGSAYLKKTMKHKKTHRNLTLLYRHLGWYH
jgi:hypothetical protein